LVPAWIGADRTDFQLGEVPALIAAADSLHGFGEYGRQFHAPFPVAFKQVQGHSLGRLGPDTRQTAQGIGQLIQEGF